MFRVYKYTTLVGTWWEHKQRNCAVKWFEISNIENWHAAFGNNKSQEHLTLQSMMFLGVYNIYFLQEYEVTEIAGLETHHQKCMQDLNKYIKW